MQCYPTRFSENNYKHFLHTAFIFSAVSKIWTNGNLEIWRFEPSQLAEQPWAGTRIWDLLGVV